MIDTAVLMGCILEQQIYVFGVLKNEELEITRELNSFKEHCVFDVCSHTEKNY